MQRAAQIGEFFFNSFNTIRQYPSGQAPPRNTAMICFKHRFNCVATVESFNDSINGHVM